MCILEEGNISSHIIPCSTLSSYSHVSTICVMHSFTFHSTNSSFIFWLLIHCTIWYQKSMVLQISGHSHQTTVTLLHHVGVYFTLRTTISVFLITQQWGLPSASDPRAKNMGQRATRGTVLTSPSLSPWCDCRRLGSTLASWRWQDINVGNLLWRRALLHYSFYFHWSLPLVTAGKLLVYTKSCGLRTNVHLLTRLVPWKQAPALHCQDPAV